MGRAPTQRTILPVLLVLLLAIAQIATAVKHHDFKTCAQSGFCKRNRAFADQASVAGPSWSSPYELDSKSIKLEDGILTGNIWKTVVAKDGGQSQVQLPLKVTLLDNGVARVTIDEARRQKKEIDLRGDGKARKERYNEAEDWALVGGKNYAKEAGIQNSDGLTTLSYGYAQLQLVIQHKPFKVTLFRDGEPTIVLNDRNLLNVEEWRAKVEKPEPKEGEEAVADAEDESTWWDETFGGNTDSKPRG